LPLTEKIVGRVADFLIKSDGAKVAGISLIENTLTKIPGIKQMQIVQKEIDEIILNIVPDSNFTTENESKLINYFKELFGSDIILRLRKIPEIKPETNGKYRFSKCGINSFGNINYGIN
jgi:phenylacetate-CoA ligase